MKKRNISYSEMSAYWDCPYKWFLKYVQKIKTDSPHFAFGSLGHSVIETRIIPDEHLYPELKEFFEIPSWSLYFETVLKGIDHVMEVNTLEVIEREIFVADDALGFHGKIDAVATYKGLEGYYYIIDYKFTKNTKSYIDIRLDGQLQLYAKLYANQHGIDEDKIRLAYISAPKIGIKHPAVLKDGRISTRSKTTYELFMETIEQEGLNPDDYTERIEELKIDPFVRFVMLPLNTENTDAMIEQMKHTQRKCRSPIIDVAKKYTSGCAFCDCVSVCKKEVL